MYALGYEVDDHWGHCSLAGRSTRTQELINAAAPSVIFALATLFMVSLAVVVLRQRRNKADLQRVDFASNIAARHGLALVVFAFLAVVTSHISLNPVNLIPAVNLHDGLALVGLYAASYWIARLAAASWVAATRAGTSRSMH